MPGTGKQVENHRAHYYFVAQKRVAGEVGSDYTHGVAATDNAMKTAQEKQGYKEAQDFEKSSLVVLLADVRDLAEYAKHDSWRCKYGECKCGLDRLTEKLGLERIPCE